VQSPSSSGLVAVSRELKGGFHIEVLAHYGPMEDCPSECSVAWHWQPGKKKCTLDVLTVLPCQASSGTRNGKAGTSGLHSITTSKHASASGLGELLPVLTPPSTMENVDSAIDFV